jgi:glycosyltransferase involved in cell wall biosynthesis/tetratricopeptide (TPR) repeat protein
MSTLSVCLITKNEEAHLARCLESVRGLWDDLVVVDTGSTDRTVEIAREFGARLFTFTWQDDFSLARNFCIEQASGDWILSLDADETIAPRDHAVIRDLLRRDDVDAVGAMQRHYVTTAVVVGWQPGPGGYDEGKPYPGFLDVGCRRLFRNRRWLRFRNRVHEELVSIDPAHPLVEIPGAWVIHHFGKLGAQDLLRAKGEGYLRIGIKKIEDDPANPQAHYELGIQYAELGRPAEALPCFERVRTLSSGFRDTELRIAICHAHLDRHEEALAAFRVAARALPQHADVIALEEANVHRKLGDDRAAERILKRALSRHPAYAGASINLAVLYNATKRTAEALACLDRALTLSPRHPDLLTLRAWIRGSAGDLNGALADLERLGTNEGALRKRARILAQQRRFREAGECLDQMSDAPDADVLSLRGVIALGLGEGVEAVRQFRRSLDLEGTYEASLNLSVALEAQRDHSGALTAAAEALGFAPGHSAAFARFTRLSGDTLRRRAVRGGADALTQFFYQPHSIPFDGRTPRTRGLGGTESAIVYLAEALAARGHRIVVFNTCEEPGIHHGVEYARWESLPARAVADRPDVVVAVREWQTIGAARFAPLQIFWTGDAFDQPFVEKLGDAGSRREIDFLMLQSDWQANTYERYHGVPAWQIVRTRLGSAASSGPVPPFDDGRGRARRLAYASTPFRGLDVLLDLFPRIRAACPDAELDVFSSMRVYGVAAADDESRYGAIYRKAEQPGVNLVGSLPQMELAARLQQARVLAYPNHYAETFCIAAIEAQAAGCAVVTSALGALPETVGDGGLCIAGDPRTAAYQQAFVDACVRLLTDDEEWSAVSRRARARAWDAYAWPAIAEHWDATCRAALRVEPPVLERVGVHLAAGRASLALKMLERETPGDGVPAEAWAAVRAFAVWRAGSAPAPPPESVRLIALHFRSFRNALLIEPATVTAG